jgi:hypothetical protein
MKHCPECNFSFPDFHHVCDFDGTELVADPERPSLVNASLRPSRFLRILKSPMLLASFAMLVLFLSAVLIGYYDSNIPPVVEEPPSPPSLSVARDSTPSPALIKTPVPSKRSGIRNLNTSAGSSSASLRRQVAAPHSVARLRQETSISKRAQKAEIARRRNAQPSSDERDPKLVAILKTTWNVLKKPFRF